jgi:2-keto-3-deoxy-L-rhamnonate aldolase RhmA
MSIFEPIRNFRRQLDAGRCLIGAGVTFSDPLVTEALAPSVDFLWIDLEHTPLGPEALAGHLLAGRATAAPCLVRVVAGTTACIKPVIDSGAMGIIVPQIETAEEACSVVRNCRYPPVGSRGYGPRVPSGFGRFGSTDYIDEANRLLFVAVQIENAAALADIDRIVAIPGLDSVVIGPYDLSASLGVFGQLQHAELLQAIKKIVDRARAAGKCVGAGMGPDPAYAALLAELGVQWLQVGGDDSYMIQCAECIRQSVMQRLDEASGRISLRPVRFAVEKHRE